MSISRTSYKTKSGTPPAEKNLQKYGPLIQVIIAPAKTAAEPDTPGHSVNALIDTGASLCCIDEILAKKIGLRLVNHRPLHGVAGEKLHPVYYGSLTIPSLNLKYRGQLTGAKLSENHPILLGRDILEQVIMIYDGPTGQITLSN